MIVEFIDDKYFEIKIQFPFLLPIINRRLLSEEVDNYFKTKKYLKLTIENETIKGNYFEEAVKIGLKNKIKLPAEIDNTIEVKEIATMNEINKNSLDYFYLEEESSQDDSSDEADNKQNDFDDNKIQTENAKITEIKIDKRKNEKIDKNEIDNIKSKFDINNNNINPFSKDIEYYRSMEISKLYDGKYNIKKVGKNYDGKKTYFLEQKNQKGKVIDCALLYGEEKNKTFIGFKIKCYFKETKSLPPKEKNKIDIKDNIKEILINSMYILNCKITSWHYYLIFYINNEIKNCNVNDSVLDDIENKIEAIYYDPVNKIFYDLNEKIINNLKLTLNSNLDNMNYPISKMSINPSKIYKKKKRYIEDEKIEQNFIKDFSYLKEKTVNNIIIKILQIMEVNEGIYKLEHKISELPTTILSPSINYIYLYKRNNNKGFIGVKLIDDANNINITHRYYDLNNKEEINFVEVDCLYFYSLIKKGKEKIKRSTEKINSISIKEKPKLKYQKKNSNDIVNYIE